MWFAWKISTIYEYVICEKQNVVDTRRTTHKNKTQSTTKDIVFICWSEQRKKVKKIFCYSGAAFEILRWRSTWKKLLRFILLFLFD